MFLTVEGMDGVGKTTLAKNIADKFNYKYVEKPIQKAFKITDEQFDEFYKFVCSRGNKNVIFSFFMLGNLLARYYDDNIVSDRHILSSYFWDANDENELLFDYFCKGDIIPDLTLILYASEEKRRERIALRDINDSDLNDKRLMCFGYDKMLKFANKINLPYILINTDDKDQKQVFEYCCDVLTDFFTNKFDSKEELCQYYNELFFNKQIDNKVLMLKKNS